MKGTYILLLFILFVFNFFITNVNAVDISTCQNLNTLNTVYNLLSNVSANQCFTISANNITLDGNGYWVSYGMVNPTGYGLIINNVNNTIIKNLNFIQDNTGTGGSPNPVRLSNDINVSINNVNMQVYGDAGTGMSIDTTMYLTLNNSIIYITSGNDVLKISNSNNSIIENTSIGGRHATIQTDTWDLTNIGTTTNFTNTNFTTYKNINFHDNSSWFNYRNDSSNNIWLKTNVSTSTILNRTLISFTNKLMKWNDTNLTTYIIARYNITGLIINSNYSVYNTSLGIQTNSYNLTTDINGNLQSFTINLNDNTEIIINYSGISPSWSSNSTNLPSPQTYNTANNYGFQINSSASNGMNNTWFQLGRPSGSLTNYTALNNSASGADVWYYNLTQSALGGVGTYNYTWFLNDTSNLQNRSDTVNYVINKAATLMNLSLNGTQGNRSYRQNEISNFTAWLNVSKLIYLWSNMTGFIQQSGTTSITNYTNLTNITAKNYYNLTANWTGDENYTDSQIDYLFNVTIPLLTVSIVPSPAQVTDNLNCTYNYLNSAGYPDTNRWFQWYINNTANATVQNLSSSNLTLGANIVCSVKLFDGTANSSWTNSSTLTIGDTVSPILKNASLSAGAGYTNVPFTIYVNATEANSMSYVYVEMTDPNAVKTNFTMSQDNRSGMEYRFSKTYTPIISGDYSFRFFASDGSGNPANLTTSLVYSVTANNPGGGTSGGGGSPSPLCNVGYSLIGGLCVPSDIGFTVSPASLSANVSGFSFFGSSSQLTVANTGNSAVNITASVSGDKSAGWIILGNGIQNMRTLSFTLPPPSGFQSGTLYITYQIAAPANMTGNYNSVITFTNVQNGNSVKIPITINVVPSAPLPLGAVAGAAGVFVFILIAAYALAKSRQAGRKKNRFA